MFLLFINRSIELAVINFKVGPLKPPNPSVLHQFVLPTFIILPLVDVFWKAMKVPIVVLDTAPKS